MQLLASTKGGNFNSENRINLKNQVSTTVKFLPGRVVWKNSMKCTFVDSVPSLRKVSLFFYQNLKGLDAIHLQVSRSIGDAYLKRAEFNREPLLAKFRLREPFDKPILKAEPSIFVQKLYPEDQFLIFASDGLWEHLSNQEAVDIVKSSSRNVGLQLQLLNIVVFILIFIVTKDAYFISSHQD